MKRIKFNDIFAVWLTGLIFTAWILDSMERIQLDDQVQGALIPVFTAIMYYYFRKAQKVVTP
uniref:Uncharacterized protein n=1 Tax=viral metagenome TaxID=1070528 RepID=A0A6M3JGA1_9ZZZZ